MTSINIPDKRIIVHIVMIEQNVAVFCILEFLTVVGWITDTYLSDFIQTFSQDITEDLKAASY